VGKKRGHGEGTIYKRNDGSWTAQVSIGRDPATGKLKRRTFYGKTRKEVQEKLDTVKAEVKTGTYIEQNKVTFGDWITRWLELYVKPTVKMSTFSKYRINVDTHAIPKLGEFELQRLTTDQIQEFYNNLAKTHSSSVLAILHHVVSGALKATVKHKFILNNPAENTVRPTVNYKEVIPLSPAEVKKYLEAARSERLYAAFFLDFYSGLRRGELLALHWSDIDLTSGVLTVRQSLNRVENYDKKTQLVFSEPKTASGKREIPLLPFVVQELKAHKARQAREKLLVGQEYQDNGLVFATAEGRPIEPRHFLRKHKDILSRAGIRSEIRIHDIRHTFGTLLGQAGENPKNIQTIMGHADIRTTLGTYCHSNIEDKKRAMERLEGVLKA